MNVTSESVFKSLKEKKFFKLICGASYSDIRIVENLVFLFTLAEADVIDLAPTADVILAAQRGVKKALDFNPKVFSPVLMASINIDSDPHFRKIEVDYSKCDVCGVCVKLCPTNAFKINSNKEFIYFSERCYGCDLCPSKCHVSALKLIETKPTPYETLLEVISLGITSVEFHFGSGYKKLENIWSEIKDLIKKINLISFSVGSEMLTELEIIDAAKMCYKLAGENIIIQCDGIPMGGVRKGEHKDKSSFEVAKLVLNEKLPVFIQISGGTDEGSYKSAVESNLNINGVAIGSYAKKLLMPYLLDLSGNNLNEALKISKRIVSSVKK